MKYSDRRVIDVTKYIEKKNGLSYVSWASAADLLMLADPEASWEYLEPRVYGNETMMVFCKVTAFGKSMTAQLPVMNHRNQAIANPDAFAVNTAMQRCLAKAIALHGIGLHVYQGEDVPPTVSDIDVDEASTMTQESLLKKIDEIKNSNDLALLWKSIKDKALKEATLASFTARKKLLLEKAAA